VRSAPQPPTPPEGENERVIFDRLMAARAENRPVSRHMLSQMLHESKGLPPKEAFALVDTYCETEAPSTPEYLSTEFMVPYLKWSAAVSAVLAVAITGISAQEVMHGKRQWTWGFLAAFLFLACR
jgi:hypothetical protein